MQQQKLEGFINALLWELYSTNLSLLNVLETVVDVAPTAVDASMISDLKGRSERLKTLFHNFQKAKRDDT